MVAFVKLYLLLSHFVVFYELILSHFARFCNLVLPHFVGFYGLILSHFARLCGLILLYFVSSYGWSYYTSWDFLSGHLMRGRPRRIINAEPFPPDI